MNSTVFYSPTYASNLIYSSENTHKTSKRISNTFIAMFLLPETVKSEGIAFKIVFLIYRFYCINKLITKGNNSSQVLLHPNANEIVLIY